MLNFLNSFFFPVKQGLNCSVTYQIIDTECGCVKLSYNRLRFLSILQSETQSGVFIVAENIFSIDKILYRLPEYVSDIKRRKTIIAITNTTDLEFDELTVNILTKLFKLVTLVNVILITPCNDDPEVRMELHENLYISPEYREKTQQNSFFRLFEHISHINHSFLEIRRNGAYVNFYLWTI